ncbi:MAG: T9SS type A sorting domain-containing protein, partial [Bacteroidota bacterium]
KDEMLFDSFEWTYYQPGDELIDIGSLLANDSLLTPTAVQEITSAQVATYAYPNPAAESVTVVVMSESIENCELKLFDMFGKEVRAEVKRSDVFTIGRGTMPSGVYFYEVKAGKNTGGGKIIFMPE